MTDISPIQRAAAAISHELDKVRLVHYYPTTAYEAWAQLDEAIEDYWIDVKRRSSDAAAICGRLVRVGAVCVHILLGLTGVNRIPLAAEEAIRLTTSNERQPASSLYDVYGRLSAALLGLQVDLSDEDQAYFGAVVFAMLGEIVCLVADMERQQFRAFPPKPAVQGASA